MLGGPNPNAHLTRSRNIVARENKGTTPLESFDIVVIDAHGSYERRTELLRIELPEGAVPIDDLIPPRRVPPLWILSACDTSVTGAMRGCFVRKLWQGGGSENGPAS
jgi:hypothetical protein